MKRYYSFQKESKEDDRYSFTLNSTLFELQAYGRGLANLADEIHSTQEITPEQVEYLKQAKNRVVALIDKILELGKQKEV